MDDTTDHIARNWHDLQARVGSAAERAGRRADDVTIIAVTKTRSAAEVSAALQAGVTDVGENRVQEADAKHPQVQGSARWHLIGQLQRNKAARAVELFDTVHSVDSSRLADTLERRALAATRAIDILLQVNTSGAERQAGVPPDALPELLDHVARLPSLRVRGLMTIAAHSSDAASVRACFRQLHDLLETHRHRGPQRLDTLSMGMSSDFDIAIEEGATMIRVGTALFGQRTAATGNQA